MTASASTTCWRPPRRSTRTCSGVELGEAVKDVDPNLLANEPSVPWQDVAGMRGGGLVLADGMGAPARVDRRGRLTLPAWLLSAAT
jgi:hypothetical protein